ncbi:hypothetical protein [Streptomyces sp. NPDC056982]|uniref:hypothetical protein n=1 Tax=Streptomyces sp. NPDC056982 TaxID=3345986 RepID=UPI003642C430
MLVEPLRQVVAGVEHLVAVRPGPGRVGSRLEAAERQQQLRKIRDIEQRKPVQDLTDAAKMPYTVTGRFADGSAYQVQITGNADRPVVGSARARPRSSRCTQATRSCSPGGAHRK